MLENKFRASRKLLISLLINNGYYGKEFENKGMEISSIPHYQSISRNRKELNRLKEIFENTINNNRYEISNYLFLKCQMIGHLYDVGFLHAKKADDFMCVDTNILCTYISDIEETICLNFEKNKKGNRDIIEMRFDGLTLESVGQRMGLTRERVRQIVSKYIKSLDYIFKDIFILYFNNCVILSEDLEVLELSDELKSHVLNYMSNSKMFRNVKMFDIYVFDNVDEYDRILRLINEFHNSPSIGEYDIDELLTKLNVNISRELIIDSLILNKYSYYNGKYIKYRKYADYLVEIICTNFQDGIELRQLERTEDFDRLIYYSNMYFPSLKFVAEPRSVQSRLAEKLVSIDRSIYIPKKLIEDRHFDISFILEYLESTNLRIYYFSELYSRFSAALKFEGISNWYFLRELIRLNYYGDAEFSRDFFEIKKRTGSGFLDERVADYVRESDVPVTTKQISTRFSDFSQIMLYSAINKNSKLIRWGRDSWLSIEKYNTLQGSKALFENTLKIIEQKKYLSFEKLFYYLSIDNNLKIFCIFSPDNLSAFLKKMYPTSFRYFDEGVALPDSEISDKVEERYISLLGTYPEWNYQNMKHLMSELELKPNIVSYINRELNSNSIRIDRENNILSKKFCIDQELIGQIENEIEYILVNIDKHITPHYLIDNGYLPHNAGISWNWYIITSILNTFGTKYKVIFPIPTDRRFQGGLIIEKDNELLISDNIIRYFAELGLFRVSEVELKRYLTEKRISGNIPFEFYQNENIEFDLGYFSLYENVEDTE